MASLRSSARFLVAGLVSITAPALAQTPTQTRDALVVGQPARIAFDQLPTTSFGIVAFGFAGPGAGPCAPDLGVCLDVLDPIVFTGAVPSDFLGRARLDLLVAPGTDTFEHVATQGIWIDLSTSPFGFVTTPVVDGAVMPLSAWNLDFAQDTLDSAWFEFGSGAFDSDQAGGELRLSPLGIGTGFAWNDDSTGGAILRHIHGDFSITVRLRTEDTGSATAEPPQTPRECGGILVRNPSSAPGSRDWIGLALGSGPDASLPTTVTAIDTFGTTSSYDDESHAAATEPTRTTLRIERRGGTIDCWFRDAEDQPFHAVTTVTRVQWPLAVEVGLFVSALGGSTDVVTAVESVAFENL